MIRCKTTSSTKTSRSSSAARQSWTCSLFRAACQSTLFFGSWPKTPKSWLTYSASSSAARSPPGTTSCARATMLAPSSSFNLGNLALLSMESSAGKSSRERVSVSWPYSIMQLALPLCWPWKNLHYGESTE